MKFAMIGLGRMGMGLIQRALAGGHECVAYDANPDAVVAAAESGAIPAGSIEEIAALLEPPRLVWIMVPVPVTRNVIGDVSSALEPGDIIIDGGNSNFHDSMANASRVAQSGLAFLDVGTSGGVFGSERGFCLMVGGVASAFQRAEPLFATLAPGVEAAVRSPGRVGPPSPAEQGYLHCGPSGSGHFAKMVHNGIEYAMMAAMAEGFNLVAHAGEDSEDERYRHFQFDIGELAELWRRGSVISSWLLDLTAAALKEDPTLDGFSGRVGDSGEGRWTAQAAIDLAVPAHTLTAALFDRFASRGEAETANKLLSAMRQQFGGHRETGSGS